MRRPLSILLGLAVLGALAVAGAFADSGPSTSTIPPDCPAGMVAGTQAGQWQPCRPIVQAVNTATLDSNGAWSITWATPFLSSSPIAHAEPIQPKGSPLPYDCGVETRTATSAAGTCWAATSQTNTITLGLNLTTNPFAAKVPQGTAVMVIGREPTQ